MGSWCQKFFAQDKLPNNAILIPGTTGSGQKQKYLSLFDRVLDFDSNLFEWYIAEKNGTQYLLMLRLYGAPMVIDLVHILKEGGVQNIVFMGAAYGFGSETRVGDIVLPETVQALDGIVASVEHAAHAGPDAGVLERIGALLTNSGIAYRKGKTVSVPCVFAQPEKSLFDPDVLALEMEAASCLYYAKKLGIRCAAILVVSDTQTHSLTDPQQSRYASMARVMETMAGEIFK